jgi:TonB family protein
MDWKPSGSRGCFLAALVLGALLGHAQEPGLQVVLKQKLSGKVVTLRTALAGERLRFDAAGALKGKINHGIRSLDADVDISDVEVTSGAVKIKGNRLFYFWNETKNQLAMAVTAPVEVTLETPKNELTESSVAPIINKVFLTTRESNGSRCTEPEQLALVAEIEERTTQKTKAELQKMQKLKNAPAASSKDELKQVCLPTGERGYKVGKGISPPRSIKAPDPEYTESARQAKIQGTVVYLVKIAENGDVSDVLLIRSLERSLDLRGAEAFRKWKFRPATFNGEPVPVIVEVEMNFRLY